MPADRYRCSACATEWNSTVLPPDKPTHCPICDARQPVLVRHLHSATPIEGGRGVVDAALKQTEALLAKYTDDVSAMLAAFMADIEAKLVAPGVAKFRAAFTPGSFVETGRITTFGSDWIPDEPNGGEPHRRMTLFLAANPGKRIRHSFEVIDDDTRDTERPPPPDEPVAADLDELENLEIDESKARALGKMVGAERGEVTFDAGNISAAAAIAMAGDEFTHALEPKGGA